MIAPSPSLNSAVAAADTETAAKARANPTPPNCQHPDAELLRLGERLDELWAAERLAGEAHIIAKDRPTDDAFMEAVRLSSEVVEEIEDMTATTLEGLKIKVRACSWCLSGAPFDDDSFNDGAIDPHPTTDIRLVSSILRDVMAMGGS